MCVSTCGTDMKPSSRFVLMKIVGDGEQEVVDYDTLTKKIQDSHADMNDYDRWIIGKTQETLSQVEKYMSKFMLGESLQAVIDLVWHDFCDRYIEIAKLQKSEMTDTVMMYAL